MQIPKKKNNKKLFYIGLLAVVILCVGGFLAYQYIYRPYAEKDSGSTKDPSKPLSTKSDKEQAAHLQEDPANKNSSPNTDPAAPISKDKVSGKSTVQMVASTDTSDDKVYIRGGVNSPVSEDGTCYALLKGPSGQSIRKDTTVLQNPASTDCKTISIPLSELASGKWSFTLHYTSTNYEGVSSEVTFSL